MSAIGRIRSRARFLPRDLGYVWGPRLASALRKLWVKLRHPHATIEFGRGTYLGPGFSLHVPAAGTFRTGPWCEFRRDFRCEIAPGAEVVIGAKCTFTYYSVIQCGGRIEIGDRCIFGQSSLIVDGNHRFRDLDRPVLEQGLELRPIEIADDVTTMTKCTIIASIGTRTFVGANAVVTKDLPAYVVAVGVPARPVDYFGPEESAPAGSSSSETSGAAGPPAASPASSQAERNSGASS